MVKGKNIDLDEKSLNAKTLAFVVALSEDKGLINIKTYPRALDKHNFVDFLKTIRKSYGSQGFGIYLDNASFHKNDVVREYCQKNQIEIIFSPVYRPEFQPSERLIGFIKQYVKKKRLINLSSNKD